MMKILRYLFGFAIGVLMAPLLAILSPFLFARAFAREVRHARVG